MVLVFMALHVMLFAAGIIQAQRGSRQFKQIDHQRFMIEVGRTNNTQIIQTVNLLVKSNTLALKAERLFIFGSLALFVGYITCLRQ